uniref:Photosystem I reaction center subunit II n=1 Tax=Karenia mikimotoi TaxID=225107 RepID=A0A0U1WP46_KARMI|nr:photosystem I subunit II [Karenia mikimotoi]
MLRRDMEILQPFRVLQNVMWLRGLLLKQRYMRCQSGGIACMKAGTNIVYFSKKEQGLALVWTLSNNNSIGGTEKYRVFRLTPPRIIEYSQSSRPSSRDVATGMRSPQKSDRGSIELIYPHDGVVPEKSTPGRAPSGLIHGSIGSNLDPHTVRATTWLALEALSRAS